MRERDESADCDQFILTENRYCEQPAEYHDEVRGQSYCEAHAQAWQRWRGAEDMTGMLTDEQVARDTEATHAEDDARRSRYYAGLE